MIMNIFIFCFIVFICQYVQKIEGFANYMTNNFCYLPSDVGTMVMGYSIIENDQKKISIEVNGELVNEGFEIDGSEEIKISLNPPSQQSVLEIVSGFASFENGSCVGKKRKLKNGKLVVHFDPEVPVSDIEIIGLWAEGYTSVKRSPGFILKVKTPKTNEL